MPGFIKRWEDFPEEFSAGACWYLLKLYTYGKFMRAMYQWRRDLLKDRFVLKNRDTVPISRLKDKKVREQLPEYTYFRTRGGMSG